MKNFFTIKFLSFFLMLSIVFSSVFLTPMSVYASSSDHNHGGGGFSVDEVNNYVTSSTGFNDFKTKDQKLFTKFQTTVHYLLAWCGIIVNGASYDDMNKLVYSYLKDNNVNLFKPSTISEEPIVTEEAASAINNIAIQYYEDNSPHYYIWNTTDFSKIPASAYTSKAHYDKAQAFLKEHSNDIIKNFSTNSDARIIVYFDSEDFLFFYTYQSHISGESYEWSLRMADKEWTSFKPPCKVYVYKSSAGEFLEIESYEKQTDRTDLNVLSPSFKLSASTPDLKNAYRDMIDVSRLSNLSVKGGKAIQVFYSREDGVDFVTKTGEVYRGKSSYGGGDVIIPNSAFYINYGEIYNNINNGIQDGNGLTAEDIQKMIDEAINNAIGNGGSSGGGGGGSSGGGGLSGFLSGLGSIGDAILSILGKLLEYVGKAIELFSDTIIKVIDIIPKKFTELLTALFPFIPEEFLIAIQLMLALGVILAILKAVKK